MENIQLLQVNKNLLEPHHKLHPLPSLLYLLLERGDAAPPLLAHHRLRKPVLHHLLPQLVVLDLDGQAIAFDIHLSRNILLTFLEG